MSLQVLSIIVTIILTAPVWIHTTLQLQAMHIRWRKKKKQENLRKLAEALKQLGNTKSS